MKRAALLTVLLATAANAQSQTDCYSAGDSVHCQTTQEHPSAADGLIKQMLAPPAAQNHAVPSAPSSEAEEGAKNRRAAAYNQVGALIAQGKCAEARNLAAFYNHPDIIADTKRACPL